MDNQEPMMLGSPVGHHPSPSTSGLHHQHGGSQFLPGYLMGDPSVTTTPVLNRSMSGGHAYHPYMNSPSFGGFTPRSSPPSATMSPGNKFGHLIRSRVHGSSTISTKDKGGAPPVSSLHDENNQAYPSPGLNITHSGQRSALTDLGGRSNASFYQDSRTPKLQPNLATPRRILPSSTQDLPGSDRAVKSPPSPAQIDPFYTQGEDLTSNVELDDTWVTIFGFPSSASSYILQQFSRCGVILEHHSAPEDGNWIHIHFESKLQARKALSKSGKILPGNLMIGVTPCMDIRVMNKQTQEFELSRAHLDVTGSTHTPGTPSIHPSLANTTRSGANTPKHCTIRPLTAAYNASSSGSKVVNDVRTPQKTNGIITKAMDYIFG
uniref:nucleoporin NUP35-like n=1 Tax=Styela clava TaxID=7725 RepID=UPI0019399635|nr:nucleoporin NUP35-like [Styela clava]